jgi:sugar phosphate isomerase/epimerase
MKSLVSRREFVRCAAAIAATGIGGLPCATLADPLELPIGLQLYTVQGDLEKDFDGTVRKIGEIGYRSVEAAGIDSFQGRSPAQLRKSFSNAGLVCPSAHLVQITMTHDELSKLIDFCHRLGLEYMVCATAQIGPRTLLRRPKLTPDDFKRTAEVLNKVGATISRSGMQFAYHNHDVEFSGFPDGTTGFDVLVRNSEKSAVKYELDCGWAVYAGHDPVALLEKYPDRIKMLHVKDEKPGFPPAIGGGGSPTTEVGKGKIDWKAVFEAAKKAQIKHYFVEQEPPFSEMPPLRAVKVSYDYLHALKV